MPQMKNNIEKIENNRKKNKNKKNKNKLAPFSEYLKYLKRKCSIFNSYSILSLKKYLRHSRDNNN